MSPSFEGLFIFVKQKNLKKRGENLKQGVEIPNVTRRKSKAKRRKPKAKRRKPKAKQRKPMRRGGTEVKSGNRGNAEKTEAKSRRMRRRTKGRSEEGESRAKPRYSHVKDES